MRPIMLAMLLLAIACGSLAGCVVHEHRHGFSVHPL
jgi:hypothetical protein